MYHYIQKPRPILAYIQHSDHDFREDQVCVCGHSAAIYMYNYIYTYRYRYIYVFRYVDCEYMHVCGRVCLEIASSDF